MRRRETLSADYFDALYRGDPDPWRFATSAYEREKYRATLAALQGERSRRALEVGCSIGVLTRALAELCDHLVATDLSPIALDAARARCADLPNVEFKQVRSPADNVDGCFDLIILSEVVYYWDDQDLDQFAQQIKLSLLRGGRLLLVHWLGETDYVRSGDDAVKSLYAHLASMVKIEQVSRQAEYRLDLWRRL